VRGLAVRGDPAGFWSRAGGFSAETPATADVVQEVCEFFRARKVPKGSIMIAPSQLPLDWYETCSTWGLHEGARYAKLWRPAEAAAVRLCGGDVLDRGLWVGAVDRHQAFEWATVMMNSRGIYHRGMLQMAAATVGRSPWKTYAVWEGPRIVAVGSMFVHGDCAEYFGDITLPGARRRGAHSTLLSIRLRDAVRLGCKWLFAEVGTEKPGTHHTYLWNMLRAGFRALYERTDWIWCSD
jgi:hypothetical protein